MENFNSPTVAQMVLEDPACAGVFQRHRIDFCCAGHQTLEAVTALAAKVARVHGSRVPKLIQLATAVNELADTLEPHLDDEEEVLFPALAKGRAAPSELRQMAEEHRAIAAILDRIHEASDGFVAPAWACASYRALSSDLRALDTDVREHVHLENHVLLPRFLSVPGEP
jgi:regulator of cell morphogenesis and NO signaling